MLQLKFNKIWMGLLVVLLLAAGLAACGDISATSTPQPAATAQSTTAAGTTAATTTAASNPTQISLPTVTAAATQASTTAATAAQNTTQAATTAAQQTTSAAPTVAPTTAAPTTAPASSGPQLAYIDAGNLNVIDPSTGKQRTLLKASGSQLATGKPDWQPGNNQIVVAVQPKAGAASSLYLVNVASGEARKLFQNQPAGTSDAEPDWSADGQTLAFTRTFDNSRHEVWLADQDGQNPRKLANGQQPAFAPDNQRIAFVTDGVVKEGLNAPQDNGLHLINAKGQNEWEPVNVSKIPNDLTSLGYPFSPSTFFIQYPTWLDNGKTIAFTTKGHSGLVISINAASGKDMKFWDTQYEGGFGVVNGAENGSMLAIEGYPPSGYLTIKLLDTTGKPDLQNPTGITVGGPKGQVMALHPAINADGTQVAYLKASGADASSPDLQSIKGSLVVAQVKGNKLEEKELLKANVQALAWSR
ncbi:MAG TPA: hypothetical protein VH186_10005 [Chloroflexia bacterium]|nr:hypothetical protein [Chloroflexia bacterium]